RKSPEKGGSQKGYAGEDFRTRKELLIALRERWEKMCNRHLELAHCPERIDMRSYAKQGLDRVPEKKMLPSEWRNPQERSTIIEFRHIRREQENSEHVLHLMEKQDEIVYSPEITRDMNRFQCKHELFNGMRQFKANYQQDKLQKAQKKQQKIEEIKRQEERIKLLEKQRTEHDRQIRQRTEQEKKQKQRHSPGPDFSR
ncbi:MobA/MobL family protein, partial [Xenorhabdus sp. M]